MTVTACCSMALAGMQNRAELGLSSPACMFSSSCFLRLKLSRPHPRGVASVRPRGRWQGRSHGVDRERLFLIAARDSRRIFQWRRAGHLSRRRQRRIFGLITGSLFVRRRSPSSLTRRYAHQGPISPSLIFESRPVSSVESCAARHHVPTQCRETTWSGSVGKLWRHVRLLVLFRRFLRLLEATSCTWEVSTRAQSLRSRSGRYAYSAAAC